MDRTVTERLEIYEHFHTEKSRKKYNASLAYFVSRYEPEVLVLSAKKQKRKQSSAQFDENQKVIDAGKYDELDKRLNGSRAKQ